MTKQCLTLKCNRSNVFHCDDITNNISKQLRTFYEKEEFFDVVLKAGIDNVEVKAHRIVIFAASDAFSNGNKLELAKAERIVIEGINGVALNSIVKFIYTANIELRSETVESILIAACNFKMRTLISACCDFIWGELEPYNCLGIALFAKKHSYTELYKKATKYASRHFNKVCTEEEFMKLDEDQLSELLMNEDFTIASQEKLLLSLAAWVDHDKANREKLTMRLLTHVRFTLLDPKFIVANSKSICKTSECEKLILSWLQWHLSTQNQLAISANSNETQNKLFFISGRSIQDLRVQVFNPHSNTWATDNWPQPLQNRFHVRLNCVSKNLIVAVGGEHCNQPLHKVEYMNIETKSWNTVSPMIYARLDPCITELDGDLFVVGGSCKGKFLHSVEKFNFLTNKWQLLAPLSETFTNVQIAALDGLLYAIGEIYTEKYCSLFECYDPTTNKWTKKAFKNEKSLNFGIAAVNGYIYAVGGTYKLSLSRTVERYDPLKNTWTFVKPLIQGLVHILCASLNNRLIACGQYDGKYIVDEYDPERNTWTNLAPFSSIYQYNHNFFSNCN